MDDWDLLSAYAHEKSEQAFATLVERYVDLVYSAALRQLPNPEQARDVSQAVFLMLARKAGTIKRGTVLSGWLYRTARFVALEALRSESRRKRREEAVAQMNIGDSAAPEIVWKDVASHIDEAMEELPESDRTAILYRFFQGRSVVELAETLGISEEAAKKRIARALERLARILKRHGVTSSTSALTVAVTTYSVQSAPAALSTAISAAICHGPIASIELLTTGAMHMITWTKAKTMAACVAALLLTSTTVTTSVLDARARHDHLQFQAALAAQLADESARQKQVQQELIAAENDNRALRKEAAELHSLRNTVAQLEKQRRALLAPPSSLRLDSAPSSLRASAETLRELQFEEFIAAGRKALTLKPLTNKEFPTPEYISEINFMKRLGLAIRMYAAKHKDEFPPSLNDLLQTDLVEEDIRKKLQEGRYEYHRFTEAEKKPGLPAVWWQTPDERGIRMLVLNDGSVQRIREPGDVPAPGYLAKAEAK